MNKLHHILSLQKATIYTTRAQNPELTATRVHRRPPYFSIIIAPLNPSSLQSRDNLPLKIMHRFKPSLRFLKSNSYNYKPSRHFCDQTHLNNVGPIVSHLKSRSVIRFQGSDTVKFLQGLLTNDVRRFCEPIGEETSNLPTPNVSTVSEKPMYAAMLTPQGRFLYDMFLYRPSRSYEKLDSTGSRPGSDSDEPFELFMDVDTSALDEITQSFNKYRLRSKVDIENVAEDFSCWQCYGGNISKKSSSTEEPEAVSVGYGATVDPSALSASRGNNVGWQWFNDPRLDCLGFRGIFPSDTIPPLVEADKETAEENYLLWRLEKGVAEGSIEIPKGEAIPLEYNLVGLNAISFDKGCYVGQEFIARTHHRGTIRKRLLPLTFIDNNGSVDQKVSPGSEVVDTSSGKKVGNVTTALGSRGMGVLRLDEAFKRSNALIIGGQEDVKVQATRPEWWPSEWLEEREECSAAA